MDKSTFKEILTLAKKAGVHNYQELDMYVTYDLAEHLAEQISSSDFEKLLEKVSKI